MPEKKPFGATEKHRAALRVVMIVFMAAVSVLSIYLAFHLHAARERFKLANTVIDIATMIAALLLILCSGRFDISDDPREKFFRYAVYSIFAASFFSCIAVLSEEIASRELVLASLSASYAFCGVYWAMFWLCQRSYFEATRLDNIMAALVLSFCVLYGIIVIMNLFTGEMFAVNENARIIYPRRDMVSTIMIILVMVFYALFILTRRTSPRKKIIFLGFILFPVIVLVISLIAYKLRDDFDMTGLLYFSYVLPLYMVYANFREDEKSELYRKSAENAELRTAVMLSQIGPHFIYNSLATISALCEVDPGLAGEATNKFSDYLRENMDSLDDVLPVPFEKELRHVESYVWLEELRFSDRLKVEYDIEATGFSLPSLTVQPLVENAIKHGVCRKPEGGTVKIASRETDKAFAVTVSDDGVGFDPDRVGGDGRSHIGIENVRERLATMVGGTLEIDSTPGAGTTVTVTVPRQK